MWILPKSLISAFAPGTEALTLDSSECSQACARSLMRRSKPSLANSYLREWKAGNLMRLRSGAISSHFLGKTFEAWWTSLVEVTHVSHFPHQDYAKEPEMKGTCGPILQKELQFCDQVSVSLKMSKGTLPLGSVTFCNNWENWVIDRRGEYSARLKLAQSTSGDESSCLPTPCANEDSFRLNGNSQQSKCLEAKARRGELGEPGPLNPQFVEAMMGLPIGWTDCAF